MLDLWYPSFEPQTDLIDALTSDFFPAARRFAKPNLVYLCCDATLAGLPSVPELVEGIAFLHQTQAGGLRLLKDRCGFSLEGVPQPKNRILQGRFRVVCQFGNGIGHDVSNTLSS